MLISNYKKLLIGAAALPLLGLGCQVNSPGIAKSPIKIMNQESVTFETSDGITISADWYPAESAHRFALLLHMMPSTKESWEPLAAALQEAGIAVLAIDLRGHGESTQSAKGHLDYKAFEDEDHHDSIRDVDAAVAWLKQRGASDSNVVVAGASIGANLAILYGSQHKETSAIVALSPGLDYHGVKTEAAVTGLAENQKLMLVVASGDTYSFDSVSRLDELAATEHQTSRYQGTEHGTNLFETDPELISKIVAFVSP